MLEKVVFFDTIFNHFSKVAFGPSKPLNFPCIGTFINEIYFENLKLIKDIHKV